MKELMKENYEISNLFVSKLERYQWEPLSGDYNLKVYDIFKVEDELDENTKLAILDSHTDGLGTYMLETIKQYKEDRENGTIKRDSYGGLHRGSSNAWTKKHNTRQNIWVGYPENYPIYRMFESTYRLDEITPSSKYGYKYLYSEKSIINQWFHDLLLHLLKEETTYFKQTDEHMIKLKELKEMAQQLYSLPWGTGMNKEFDDTMVVLINGKDMSNENIDKYYDKYKNIVNSIYSLIKNGFGGEE